MERIGVISDTHGQIRQSAIDALQGSSLILHAGDVCGQHVIDALRSVAPVVAVRGNMDRDAWAYSCKPTEAVEINGKFIYIIHDLFSLDIDPAGQFDVVIFGHTHMPEKFTKQGVLYFNPGSAGPRRSEKPVSAGILEIDKGTINASIINLEK